MESVPSQKMAISVALVPLDTIAQTEMPILYFISRPEIVSARSNHMVRILEWSLSWRTFWLEIHKNVKNLHSVYARNFVKGSANKNKNFHKDLWLLNNIKFQLFVNLHKFLWNHTQKFERNSP